MQKSCCAYRGEYPYSSCALTSTPLLISFFTSARFPSEEATQILSGSTKKSMLVMAARVECFSKSCAPVVLNTIYHVRLARLRRRDPTSQQVSYLTGLSLREVNAAMKVFLLLWYGWMVQAHISSFQNGRDIIRANDGERRSFILGKDTELFHASVDLNWLTRTLTDKSTWTSWYSSIVHRLKRLNSRYNNEYTYQNVAIDLISEFRELNPSSPIRLEGSNSHLIQ